MHFNEFYDVSTITFRSIEKIIVSKFHPGIIYVVDSGLAVLLELDTSTQKVRAVCGTPNI